jgi:PTS system nitrogen regulatory IIA component
MLMNDPNPMPTIRTLATALQPHDVCLELDVADKTQLFDAIGLHTERYYGLAHQLVATSLSRRERIGSTGLGRGVAIPHARIEGLERVHALYARLKFPIPFDARDGKPVSDCLVLLVPAPATDEHLIMLAEATELFSERRFLANLRSCSNPDQVLHLFYSWPHQMHAEQAGGTK